MKITHLRASSAHRWMVCHGSPHAERIAYKVAPQNDFTTEGTAAHRLLELCLKRKVDADTFVGDTIRLTREKIDYEITEEMADHIQDGLDLIRDKVAKGVMWSEAEVHSRVSISGKNVIVGGTLDAGWYGKYPSAQKRAKGKPTWQLHILDLKYGRLLVEAHDNDQMRIYAKGKLRELEAKGKPVDEIHLWVYQPRNEVLEGIPFQHVVIEPFDLAEFDLVLEDAVKGVLQPVPKLTAGSHCLYCSAQATCPAAEKLALQKMRRAYRENDRAAVGELLYWATFASKWAERVKALGKQMGNDNKPPTGWKMIPGNRVRRFPGKEKEQLAKVLPKLKKHFKLADDDLAPRKLLSVSKVEKVLKEQGHDIEALEKFYIETRQQDRLVPESDKRTAAGHATLSMFDAEGADDGQFE